MRVKRDGEFDLAFVAYLCAQNFRQSLIARTVGISQSQVSRLRRRALDVGILKRQIQFAVERVEPDHLREIEVRLQPSELMDKIHRGTPGSRKRLRNVRIFDSGPDGVHAQNARPGRHPFASAAAPFVTTLMRKSKIVGVAWGSTIGHIIEALDESNLNRSGEAAPEFCPLAGDPMQHSRLRFSSSRLAERLAERFGTGDTHTPSLAGVPALLPQSFTDQEVATLKKLLIRFHDYALVFGRGGIPRDPNALVRKVDTILTGAGPADHALGYPEGDTLVLDAEIEREKLEPLIFGDVCGALLLRPHLSKDERDLIDRIRVRWVGIDEAALEHCAKRSPEHGNVGVIAVCVGEKSHEVVIEALRRGLINHLILDRPLAEVLEAKFDEMIAAQDAAERKPARAGAGGGKRG